MNRRFHLLRAICRDAVERGAAEGMPVCAVAIDLDGRIVVELRDDGCSFLALDPARGKALGALMMRMPTNNAAGIMGSDPILSRAIDAATGVVMVPGGMPVMLDGEVIGAVGVAGGHYSKDHLLCEAAVAAAMEPGASK